MYTIKTNYFTLTINNKTLYDKIYKEYKNNVCQFLDSIQHINNKSLLKINYTIKLAKAINKQYNKKTVLVIN
jgi:hypothetical protein